MEMGRPQAELLPGEEPTLWRGGTPKKLRSAAELVVPNDRKVEGLENLRKIPNNRRVIIVTPHFSNLDAPLIVDALGDLMNIQIVGMSAHFDDARKYMFKLAGEKSFSPVSYEKMKSGIYRPIFNPKDFENIRDIAESENKVPWISTGPLQMDKKMGKIPIGPAYLAELMDAVILPVTVVVEGPGSSFEGADILKAATGKTSAVVRVGEPFELSKKVDLEAIKKAL